MRKDEIVGGGMAGGKKRLPRDSERVRLADRDGAVGAIMLAPAVIYVAALVAFPFFLAIALSLSDATIGNPSIQHFVGLANFFSVIHEAPSCSRCATASLSRP